MRRCLTLAALLAGTLACGGVETSRERPLVLVSVAPQRFFVERLAGGRVAVAVMLPPGASPALYAPTLSQLRLLHEANLYIAVGHPAFPFEAAQLARLLAERPELPVVASSEGVAQRAGDPHVWLAPAHARVMTRNLARALAVLLPADADSLREAEVRLRAEIDAVDAELRADFEGHRGQRFFVFHPAWGYLADAYGLEQVAVEKDHKEPDARALAQLVAEARAAGVTAIFVQPQIASHGAQVIASEIGAEVIVLDPLAEDWSANLRRAGALIAEHLVP